MEIIVDKIIITLSLGFISNSKGGIMLTVSCLEILPFPVSEIRKLCNR